MKNYKKLNTMLNNYTIAVTLLIVTIPPIQYTNHKHTENYKNLMNTLEQFEQRQKANTVSSTPRNPLLESIIPTVHAETIQTVPEPTKKPKITIMSDEEVYNLINRISKERNFKYSDYLYRLATCENKRHPNDFFDISRTNVQGNKPHTSIDRSLFMINDYWHKEVPDSVAFDPEAATNWTITRIEQGYQTEWMCDKLIKANPEKYRYHSKAK